MEVKFTPGLEKKLHDLAAEPADLPTSWCRTPLPDMSIISQKTRAMIDRRYDEIKSGKVKLIPAGEVEAYFRQKYEDAKLQPGS